MVPRKKLDGSFLNACARDQVQALKIACSVLRSGDCDGLSYCLEGLWGISLIQWQNNMVFPYTTIGRR